MFSTKLGTLMLVVKRVEGVSSVIYCSHSGIFVSCLFLFTNFLKKNTSLLPRKSNPLLKKLDFWSMKNRSDFDVDFGVKEELTAF